MAELKKKRKERKGKNRTAAKPAASGDPGAEPPEKDYVSFTVRFATDLYAEFERYYATLPHKSRPSKGEFIQMALATAVAEAAGADSAGADSAGADSAMVVPERTGVALPPADKDSVSTYSYSIMGLSEEESLWAHCLLDIIRSGKKKIKHAILSNLDAFSLLVPAALRRLERAQLLVGEQLLDRALEKLGETGSPADRLEESASEIVGGDADDSDDSQESGEQQEVGAETDREIDELREKASRVIEDSRRIAEVPGGERKAADEGKRGISGRRK